MLNLTVAIKQNLPMLDRDKNDVNKKLNKIVIDN